MPSISEPGARPRSSDQRPQVDAGAVDTEGKQGSDQERNWLLLRRLFWPRGIGKKCLFAEFVVTRQKKGIIDGLQQCVGMFQPLPSPSSTPRLLSSASPRCSGAITGIFSVPSSAPGGLRIRAFSED